jgi:hypothetical protein
MGKSRKRNAWCALRAPGAFAAVLLLHFSSVHAADPAAHVNLPSVVQGEVEFELNGGYQQWPGNSDNGERQLIYEAGYGVTSWWKSELGIGSTRLPGESTHLDELEWENIFALTEPGEYWLDLGLFAELEHDYGEHGNAVTMGPMLQKEFGAAQANVNLLFSRGLGALASQGTEFDYDWQVKWRGNPLFEPGVQGFGTLGSTGAAGHPTAHKLGPAFFSQTLVGRRNKLKFDTALLFGLNANSPHTTLRFTLEFEIY